MSRRSLAVPARGFCYADEYDESDDEPRSRTQLARRNSPTEMEAHRGGPTAEEQRHAWQRTHRQGVSGRALAPGKFALYYAWREMGGDEAAADRFNRAGLFDQLRESVFDDMAPDSVEAVQMVAQARLFDKQLLGRMMRARLPEMVAGATTPAEIGRAVRDLERVQDWVWNAGIDSVQAAPVRGELEEV
jgi:hypothetical protein